MKELYFCRVQDSFAGAARGGWLTFLSAIETALAASAMTPAVPSSSQCAGLIGKKLLTSFHPVLWTQRARTSAATVLLQCPHPTTAGQTTRTARSSVSPNYQHSLESGRTSCR